MRKSLLILSLMLFWAAPDAHAGPWTLKKGEILSQLSLFGSRSRSTFNAAGEKVRFNLFGKSRNVGTSLRVAYGLTDRITLYGALPYLSYRASDALSRTSGSSLGDLRVSARLQLLESPFLAAFEPSLKFPTADATDARQVQVGEGQYDFDFIGSIGRAWPGWSKGYSAVDVGYRLRRRDADTGFKPGNEVFYSVESGYALSGRAALSVTLGGFRNRSEGSFGFPYFTKQFKRSLIALTPAVGYALSRYVGVSAGVSLPLDGRNYYAGRQGLLTLSIGNAPGGSLLAGGGALSAGAPKAGSGSCCSF